MGGSIEGECEGHAMGSGSEGARGRAHEDQRKRKVAKLVAYLHMQTN